MDRMTVLLKPSKRMPLTMPVAICSKIIIVMSASLCFFHQSP